MPISQLDRHRRARLRKFGCDSTFDELVSAQNGQCAICGEAESKLLIDHCHATLSVRGLLCSSCNSGLGFFRDRPDLLRNAIGYLSARSATVSVRKRKWMTTKREAREAWVVEYAGADRKRRIETFPAEIDARLRARQLEQLANLISQRRTA